MSHLVVRHCRSWYEPRLPHLLFIDGLYAGTMQGDEWEVEVPRGSYEVRVQFGGRVPIGKRGRTVDLSVSAAEQVEVRGNTEVQFRDREKIWNILFDIDLLVWVVSWFVQLPSMYKVVSDMFFVVWIVRLLVIRKRYYKFSIQ